MTQRELYGCYGPTVIDTQNYESNYRTSANFSERWIKQLQPLALASITFATHFESFNTVSFTWGLNWTNFCWNLQMSTVDIKNRSISSGFSKHEMNHQTVNKLLTGMLHPIVSWSLKRLKVNWMCDLAIKYLQQDVQFKNMQSDVDYSVTVCRLQTLFKGFWRRNV